MKRILFIATIVLLMLSLTIGASATRRVEVTIDALATAPAVDGEIKAGEYGDPVVTISSSDENFNQYYSLTKDNDNSTVSDLPTNSTFYVNYDSENLYLAAVIETPNFVMGCCDSDGNWWHGSHMIITFTSDLSDKTFTSSKPALDMPNRLLVWFNTDGTLKTKIDKAESGVLASGKAVSGDVGTADYSVEQTTTGNKVTFEIALKWSQIVPAGTTMAKDSNFLLAMMYYEADAAKGTAAHNTLSRNTLISAAGTAANINHVSKHFKLTLGDVLEDDTPVEPPVSPETFDSFSVVGLLAVVSVAGIVLARKKKI